MTSEFGATEQSVAALLRLIDERDRRYTDLMTERDKRYSERADAQAQTLTKLEHQATQYAESISAKVDILAAKLDLMEGRNAGLTLGWRILVSMTAMATAMLTVWLSVRSTR